MSGLDVRSLLLGALGSALLLAGVWGISSANAAGIPTRDVLTYSGVLEESGVPVEGVRLIRVDLYDREMGGAPLCGAQSATASVQRGRFHMPLRGCTDVVRAQRDVWAEVKVDEIPPLPRQKVGAVPYAVEAERATLATNALQAMNAATAANATALVGSVSQSLFRVTTACTSLPGGGQDCSCNANEYAISGGGWAGGGPLAVYESANVPTGGPTRNLRVWRVACINYSTGATVNCGNAYATCLRVSP